MLVKAKGPLQSIAGNRLTDGVAVWLGSGGRWVERVGEAAVFQGAQIEAALAEAAAAVKAQLVVDTYPIDVDVRDGETVPTHMRERMKALGPSVRPDLGKQAEPAPAKTSPAAAA